MSSLFSSCVGIYGFFVPSEIVMNIVVSEMCSFFKKSIFSHLSYEEYYLALQINATAGLKIPAEIDGEQIKASGATVNVKFLADVMNFYIQFRNQLDRKLQNFLDGY